MKIKRLLSTLIAVIICLISTSVDFTNISAVEIEDIDVWDGSDDIFWFQEGENEFKISTAEELSGLAKLVNSGNDFAGITIVLENDIYLNDTSNIEKWNKNYLNSFEEDNDSIIPSNKWIPIGNNYNNPFCGIFDGNGYSVNGIYCINNRYSGLFGCLKGDAIIKNLTIGNGFIHGCKEAGGISAGAHYESNTQILNCINKCEILTYSTILEYVNGEYELYAGGITGYGGFITNCTNYGNISVLIPEAYKYIPYGIGYTDARFVQIIAGAACSGGITGGNGMSIYNCCNYGTVYSECEEISRKKYNSPDLSTSGLYAYSGGIVGLMYSDLKNCYNIGTVKSKGYSTIVGGICANAYNKEINSCYNVGIPQTTELSETHISSLVGGIIGKSNDIPITNSYYLNTSSEKGIGNIQEDTIVKLNQSAMKKESFAKTLGDAFVYVEGDYPKLAWEVNGYILGDVNRDGEFNISDAVMLQKWLLGAGELTNWKAGDIYKDERIDVFDLCLMKRMLFEIIE